MAGFRSGQDRPEEDARPAAGGTLASAERQAGSAFYRLLALRTAQALSRLGFLAAAAGVTGGIVVGQYVPPPWAGIALFAIVLAAAAGLLADRSQAESETRLAGRLRREAASRLSAMTARQVQAIPVGRLVVAMQRYPDAVASLVVGHRAARAMMGIGPMLAAAALVPVSWQAALAVILLTPVMILFFALVGDAIRRRADAQERAFGHLAGQFADRLRTLPTILANDALAAQETALGARLRTYADRTFGVLRVAFLNAAIIDFFSSLSIAMLAVFLGLGHLGLANIPGFSGLELWQSLFILMIAPDYFAPFRRFAEQYHAKAEGEAAARALDDLLTPGPSDALPVPVPHDLKDLPETGLVAIVGPSGTGKTSLLRHLAGIDALCCDATPPLSWIATDGFVRGDTLGQALAWGYGTMPRERLTAAAGAAGLLDERFLPGGLDAALLPGGASLSGGQRLRIGVARALLSDRRVLADEPTAKLDRANARRVREALRRIADDRLVVVATHDPDLAKLADRVIRLDALAGAAR